MILTNYVDNGLYIETENDSLLVSWEDIENGMLKNKLSKSVLVSFSYDYGRYGSWVDTYILDIEYWKDLKSRMLGKSLYLGEICGKHSDVTYYVTESSISEDFNVDAIISFKKQYGNSSLENDVIEVFLEYEEAGDFDDSDEDDSDE